MGMFSRAEKDTRDVCSSRPLTSPNGAQSLRLLMEVQLNVPKRPLDETHSVPLFLYFGISAQTLLSVFMHTSSATCRNKLFNIDAYALYE